MYAGRDPQAEIHSLTRQEAVADDIRGETSGNQYRRR